jgi:hypothetical protein
MERQGVAMVPKADGRQVEVMATRALTVNRMKLTVTTYVGSPSQPPLANARVVDRVRVEVVPVVPYASIPM